MGGKPLPSLVFLRCSYVPGVPGVPGTLGTPGAPGAPGAPGILGTPGTPGVNGIADGLGGAGKESKAAEQKGHVEGIIPATALMVLPHSVHVAPEGADTSDGLKHIEVSSHWSNKG